MGSIPIRVNKNVEICCPVLQRKHDDLIRRRWRFNSAPDYSFTLLLLESLTMPLLRRRPKRRAITDCRGCGVTAAHRTFNPEGVGSNPSGPTDCVALQ